MRIIRRFSDHDIVGGPDEWLVYVNRHGARGVLVDDRGYVGMMYMSAVHLYKLPGGGIEDGERPEDAFLREILEETGYAAEIVRELGDIEEHKNRNAFLQRSSCFVAKALSRSRNATLSESETALGMTLRWMPLNEALAVMRDAFPNTDDYSAKFMILRDTTILEVYKSGLDTPL